MKKLDYTEEEIIVLGGLLHDIGKMISRSTKYQKVVGAKNGRHQESSVMFLRWMEKEQILQSNPVLEEVVQRHHEDPRIDEEYLVQKCPDEYIRKLAYIVSRADTYSSKDRRELGDKSSYYTTRALDSTIEQLKLTSPPAGKTNKHYRLNPLTANTIFPKLYEKNEQIELEDLIDCFMAEIRRLEFYTAKQLIVGLDELMRRYTWCIPADTTKEISDISLYEHSRTSAAFAQCLYRFYNEAPGIAQIKENQLKKDTNKAFIIVAIEFDGLSAYVEDLRTNTKATKRLRGRTAYAKLLKEAIALAITHHLNLSHLCNVWEQGDIIYFILPNTDAEFVKMRNIIHFANKELYSAFDGNIYLNASAMQRSGVDVQKFNEVLWTMSDKLEKAKSRKWSTDIIAQPITSSYKSSVSKCPICDDRTVTKGQFQCKQCELELNLADDMAKHSMVEWLFDSSEKAYCILNRLPKVRFVNEVDVKQSQYLMRLSLPTKVEEITIPAITSFSASITSTNFNGELKTFEELATGATGAEYLGVFRCKVKSLNLLYQYGLVTDDEDSTSISRLGTVNMLLQYFFKAHFQQKVQCKKVDQVKFGHKNVEVHWENHSIIDASNEGLVLVGPWNELPAVAKAFKDAFAEFTCNNSEVELYFAIDMFRKKQPVKYSLDKSKLLLQHGIAKSKEATIFDEALNWRTFERLFGLGEKVVEYMEEGVFSQSFVYRLRKYAEQMHDYGANHNMESLMYMSRLSYDIGRNLKPKIKSNKLMPEAIDNVQKWFCLTGDIDLTVLQRKSQQIKIFLNYAVYKRRGE